MASIYLAVAVLLTSSAVAQPPWRQPGGRGGYNDTCRAAAPYVSALRTYDAASELCSSVLGLTAQTVTETSTEYAYATISLASTAATVTWTATASAIQLPLVTITGNSSTTTVFSNSTQTITRGGLTTTAPTSVSYTTITSTATICGNSTAAQNISQPVKRQLWGWGGKPQWRPGFHSVPHGGWRHPHDLPPALENAADEAISSGCSCMSLPVETSTVTVRTTQSSHTTLVNLFTATGTVQPYRYYANTTTIHPVVTRIATSTRTVQSLFTETPLVTSTLVETTTILIGQQFGEPTVVLASPTPLTGVNAEGLATQDFDDERYPVELPFEIEAFGVRSSSLVVSVNGWIALSDDTGSIDHYSFDNSQLPRMNSNDDWGLPDTVFLPYWNDLFIAQGTAQGLYYEVSGTSPNRNVSFEWYTSLYSQSTGYYHFIATFQEAEPGVAIFTYYQANGETPLNTGRYGTIGVQSFLEDKSTQYSYDRLVSPGLEITYDPAKNVFLRTNSVNCVLST
ncbi:hypothetical protein Slin14017_G118020 [Septoria linicola]|nr:hypothetical protein Slin14017_G118020 [Septoria linicola]